MADIKTIIDSIDSVEQLQNLIDEAQKKSGSIKKTERLVNLDEKKNPKKVHFKCLVDAETAIRWGKNAFYERTISSYDMSEPCVDFSLTEKGLRLVYDEFISLYDIATSDGMYNTLGKIAPYSYDNTEKKFKVVDGVFIVEWDSKRDDRYSTDQYEIEVGETIVPVTTSSLKGKTVKLICTEIEE